MNYSLITCKIALLDIDPYGMRDSPFLACCIQESITSCLHFLFA